MVRHPIVYSLVRSWVEKGLPKRFRNLASPTKQRERVEAEPGGLGEPWYPCLVTLFRECRYARQWEENSYNAKNHYRVWLGMPWRHYESKGCDGLIDFFEFVGLVRIRGRGVLSGLRMGWAAHSFEKRTVTGSAPLAMEGVVVY